MSKRKCLKKVWDYSAFKGKKISNYLFSVKILSQVCLFTTCSTVERKKLFSRILITWIEWVRKKNSRLWMCCSRRGARAVLHYGRKIVSFGSTEPNDIMCCHIFTIFSLLLLIASTNDSNHRKFTVLNQFMDLPLGYLPALSNVFVERSSHQGIVHSWK